MIDNAQKEITQYAPQQILLSESELFAPLKETPPVSSLHYCSNFFWQQAWSTFKMRCFRVHAAFTLIPK